jgi:hypothetical protein
MGEEACAFKGSLDVPRIERGLMGIPGGPYSPERLLIGLREVGFIDPIALLYLFAVVVRRAALGFDTELALPRSKAVRDFLRAWKFAEAFSASTGVPFRRLVSSSDHSYFGEEQTHYLEAKAATLEEYLAAKRFFGLMTRPIESSARRGRLVEREWSRWRTPLILRVLDRHLRGEGRDVARVVIYELLTNAVQHPGAASVTVGSSVYGSVARGRRQDRSFAVSVWDDGVGIADTLRQAMVAGSIRAGDPATVDRFTLKPVGWEPKETVYESTWTPDGAASDAELLLASLFQGISQKAIRTDIKPITMPGEEDRAAQMGDGLHALYRTVVNDFGGSLALRTGPLFMNVKAGESGNPTSYSVKLCRYADWPSFQGNMITARIPIVPKD